MDTLQLPVSSRPWLSAYDPGVPTSVADPGLRIDEVLARTRTRFPDHPALIFYGRQTTFRELDEAATRLARGLRRIGLNTGDRVSFFMPNCPSLVTCFYAVWRAGLIAVPINPRAIGPELTERLTDAQAAALITLDRLWDPLGPVELPPSVRHIVVAEVAEDLSLPLRIAERVTRRRRASRPGLDGQSVINLRALFDRAADMSPPSTADADAPAVLLFTGGTTGTPKAAVLTHRNLVANALQMGDWAPRLDDGAEVMLSALPLAHGYALTTCMNVSVLRGWTQIVISDARDIDRLLREIERWHVTVFPAVPTLYAAICGHASVTSGRRDLRSIEACISGAATLPSGVQTEFERLTGSRLVEGYGLSEASPATHCNPLGCGRPRDGIGLPLPNTDCRLVDIETEARVVEAGQAGVLCVSGPQVMAGYWQRPEDTAQVLRRDHEGRTWLHTGDVAEMTAEGFFRIVERKKDIIVAAGGLKVYPNEIEDVLSTHAKVLLSAVIGVPVGSPDQRAKAFVVLREGEQADAGEILAFLRTKLAAYKVPKAIEFRDELPLAFTGKVLRRVLAEDERTGGWERTQEPTGAG